MSGNKNIAPNQRRFCVLKFRPVVRAGELTPLAAHIAGAAVHRLHDYLGTDCDPRLDRKQLRGEVDATGRNAGDDGLRRIDTKARAGAADRAR
jgi:hypothetical protein